MCVYNIIMEVIINKYFFNKFFVIHHEIVPRKSRWNMLLVSFANLGKSLSEIHVSLKILPYLALIKHLFNFSIALTLFLKRLQGRRYSSSPMFKIW